LSSLTLTHFGVECYLARNDDKQTVKSEVARVATSAFDDFNQSRYD